MRKLLILGALLWSAPDRPFKSVFGWEGEKYPAIAYEDGGFFVRDGLNKFVGFKAARGAKSLRWHNHSGYLPCLVTELEKGGLAVKVSDFADKVTVRGNDYVVAYARVTLTNRKPHDVWPDVGASRQLVVLSSTEYLAPGQTADYDYAIELDRFGKPAPRLSAADLRGLGGWDEHFDRMRKYWDGELAGIAQLRTPRPDLDDSYKAGYVYTQIIKEGPDLKTGTQDYDNVYDHDANGILSGLFAVGDFRQARELLERLPVTINYDDGRWLYPWPWAYYAFQTGDLDFVRSHWKKISEVAHQTAADRTGPGGIMKKTGDTDADGFWMTDGWSAMAGLLSYAYLSRRLGEDGEAAWADSQYKSLLQATLDAAHATMRSSIGGIGLGRAAKAGLYSRRHRELPVQAYEFLLDNAQSGPYSWWEGKHPKGGDGDCPHMWGQAMNVQAVLSAIASESFDGRLVVGRGIPEDWLDSGRPVELRNFPISGGRRIGVRIAQAKDGVYELELSGDALTAPLTFDLPAFSRRKIVLATAGSVPDSGDRVELDPEVRKVQVTVR